MAKRLNPRHSEMVRAKIQATQIIKRLTSHILGEIDLKPTQLKAAELLLNKSIPSLSSVELNAVVENKRSADDFTDDELIALASGADTSGEAEGPAQLH